MAHHPRSQVVGIPGAATFTPPLHFFVPTQNFLFVVDPYGARCIASDRTGNLLVSIGADPLGPKRLLNSIKDAGASEQRGFAHKGNPSSAPFDHLPPAVSFMVDVALFIDEGGVSRLVDGKKALLGYGSSWL